MGRERWEVCHEEQHCHGGVEDVYTALIELGKGLLCALTKVPRPHWEGGEAVVTVPPASISTSTLT